MPMTPQHHVTHLFQTNNYAEQVTTIHFCISAIQIKQNNTSATNSDLDSYHQANDQYKSDTIAEKYRHALLLVLLEANNLHNWMNVGCHGGCGCYLHSVG